MTIAERISAGELDDELDDINLALIRRWGILRREQYERDRRDPDPRKQFRM